MKLQCLIVVAISLTLSLTYNNLKADDVAMKKSFLHSQRENFNPGQSAVDFWLNLLWFKTIIFLVIPGASLFQNCQRIGIYIFTYLNIIPERF